jgi:mono/diheme cytochrome c family protein
MWKKLIALSLTLVVTIVFTGAVSAMEEGNKRKGKYIYRKVYKACHERGAVETAKPPLNPDAHTQAEWKTIFEGKQFDNFGCEEEWSGLSEDQIVDIYTYLHAHASDSPTPLKCK